MRVGTVIVSCACALVVACTHTSGIQRVGPETYSMSVVASPARGGATAAKRIALEKANDFCASNGRVILVTEMDSGTANLHGDGNAEVTFKCVAASQ